MSKDVVTVEENTPIETAARIMADGKVAGLPVMRGNEIIGMITETDLFKIFLDLMGARKEGIRATILAPDKPGELAKITQAITQNGGNFISLGTFYGEDPESRTITFKVVDLDEEKVAEILKSVDEKIQDIRYC
jgi:acetoin utilization protein AcuB